MDDHNIDLSKMEKPLTGIYQPLNDVDIFKKDSNVSQHCLRKHYLEGHYSEYRCSICGMPPYWEDKELTLILDHIDGDHFNDELTNLRWVCPNCNQQLPTTCNRAWRDAKRKKRYYCIDCGKEISKGAIRCPECEKFRLRTCERPSKEELKSLIRNNSFCAIAEKYGVSDNAIRKWCKAENLPYRKREIKSYSDEEWEKI